MSADLHTMTGAEAEQLMRKARLCLTRVIRGDVVPNAAYLRVLGELSDHVVYAYNKGLRPDNAFTALLPLASVPAAAEPRGATALRVIEGGKP